EFSFSSLFTVPDASKGVIAVYSLTGNSDNPLFRINSNTGAITLARDILDADRNVVSWDVTVTVTLRINGKTSEFSDTAAVKIYLLVIDIDIDSDNNNGLGLPDRSAQEELLEDHLFAPGKVILPNINDTDGDGILDCWDGYGMRERWAQLRANSSAKFTPIVISVPAVEIDGLNLLFTYNAQVPLFKTATDGGNQAPAGNGSIRIWTKDGNLARLMSRTYIASGLPNGAYTLRELGWVPGQTEIVLYVEGISENVQTTRALAEQHGKPNTKITVEYVLIRNGNEQSLGSDSVAYVVAKQKSFYYELLEHPELVATYAANAVYNRFSQQWFTLQIQSNAVLTNLGINENIRDLLNGGVQINGFNAALYREYLTGKYVLAFAGTEITDWNDLAADVQQALGTMGVLQFDYAMDIANELKNNSNLNASNTYITGHSLGGGLASAASIMSQFHAYTFNASGLHQNTVFYDYHYAAANQLINSYRVDYDILSCLQSIPGWLNQFTGFTAFPAAIGTPIVIDSQYDSIVSATIITTAASFATPFAMLYGGIGLVEIFAEGVYCHLMDQVIYGMEKRIFVY
ncbi:MAG: hypothetical protein LBH00_01445, partial [Planctomycetaceae bacterium]|nr:hypothetical protein [Planctomycetaceae bacterium]